MDKKEIEKTNNVNNEITVQLSTSQQLDSEKIDDNNIKSPFRKKRLWLKILLICLVVFVGIIIALSIAYILIIGLWRLDYNKQEDALMNDYGGGKLSDSEIISRLNKGYGKLGLTIMESGPNKGSVVSIQKTKTEAVDMICTMFGPCNSNATEKYRHEGYYYLKGLSFGIPFTLETQNKSNNPTDTMEMSSPSCGLIYEGDASRSGADDISYWLGLDKWKKFLALYNTLGQDKLIWESDSGCKGLSYAIGLFASTQTPIASTDFAGYKFGNLFLTSLPEEGQKGGYLFFYDENSENWKIVTDDAQGLIDWLKPQLDNGSTLKSVDWKVSPIKPYNS